MKEKLYRPSEDTRYQEYIIDSEGWRDTPLRCYYVHGYFPNTERQGICVRFCFYYPEQEHYEGRFFQYFSPAPEDELESERATGEDDRISFALTHGAYFVVGNQGGFVQPMAERCYEANAQCAELSRKFARKLYGEHRPYGYCYGGSGGSFKTMGAIECTEGVWDGAVPYVIANPMATPNVFCPRVRVMRVLGEEGLKKLVDRMDAGGSGDLYEGLDELQREALEEVTRFGFPKRAWFAWPFMGDGALPVLMPSVYQMGKDYFTDFWTKPGYAGADPNSSEARDRVQFVTTVAELSDREELRNRDDNQLTVDNSWINAIVGGKKTPDVRLAQLPPADAYLYHCRFRVLSGPLAGLSLPVETLENGVVRVSGAESSGVENLLAGLAVGDEVMIDNSDYLAMQSFQRHQVPDESYTVYDMYRNEDGTPKYPQFRPLVAPMIAVSGSGTVPCGNIHCKTIALVSALDESALPWHGDWYRKAVGRARGSEDEFRLYISDNCIHDDRAATEDPQHTISYLGILRRALLDVAAWVEKGVEPCETTGYTLRDGQIELAETAEERRGLQPLVRAFVEGESCVRAKPGQPLRFTALMQTPPGAGKISGAAWDFEGANSFSDIVEPARSEDGTKATAECIHSFSAPGVYFPTIRISASRDGSLDDIFVQLRNLARVRVIVE